MVWIGEGRQESGCVYLLRRFKYANGARARAPVNCFIGVRPCDWLMWKEKKRARPGRSCCWFCLVLVTKTQLEACYHSDVLFPSSIFSSLFSLPPLVFSTAPPQTRQKVLSASLPSRGLFHATDSNIIPSPAAEKCKCTQTAPRFLGVAPN